MHRKKLNNIYTDLGVNRKNKLLFKKHTFSSLISWLLYLDRRNIV